jgi:hypothetical protein
VPTKNVIQVTFVIGRWTRPMRMGEHSAALLDSSSKLRRKCDDGPGYDIL